MIILFFCYLAATIAESDFWGNIVAPIITLGIFCFIFDAFFCKTKNNSDKLSGLMLSFSILSWALSDILWAITDNIYHIDPEEVVIITYGYAATNLFLTLALSIYGIKLFRRWNVIQIFIDTIVMSYFVIVLIWIVFLGQDIKNIVLLRGDWLSTVSIVLDFLVITWIAIWLLSMRNGKLPVYLRFIVAGGLLYAITDLVYFYEYFYSNYNPNSMIDVVYLFSFCLFSIAAFLRLDDKAPEQNMVMYNIGRKRKGNFLLIAPALLIFFKGFIVVELLQFVFVILIYNMVSSYIQNSIYKEGLLQKEKELNNVLEQKVKSRTEELVDKNKILQNLLDQDFITGLMNRRFLLSYLEETIAGLKDDETIILLYIDINRFKMITTMFGYYLGEKILYQMAERLKSLERKVEHSILASYRDDIFVFAAKGQYNYEAGYELAQEVINLSSGIFRMNDYQIRITVNIGISIFPNDAKTKEELIKHADMAMSQARMQGFNIVQEFDEKLSEKVFRKNTIEILLKRVNFNQEFMLYYQPQFKTESKKLVGFEALLRWKTASGEFIPPSEFIPIAEETGSIIPIGDWVMRKAMKQLSEWNNRFHEKIVIGINVSLKQLNTIHFLKDLKEEINHLSLKPEWVDIEITESIQLHENPDIMNMLQDIRKLGITISIDDFGTGYSSLSYFKSLPADRIKLAKELIDYIHINDFDYELVKAIILLSRTKGIKVIAEGVETIEQWECLRELQCDEIQGYLFGRPVPVDEIEATYGDVLMGK